MPPLAPCLEHHHYKRLPGRLGASQHLVARAPGTSQLDEVKKSNVPMVAREGGGAGPN